MAGRCFPSLHNFQVHEDSARLDYIFRLRSKSGGGGCVYSPNLFGNNDVELNQTRTEIQTKIFEGDERKGSDGSGEEMSKTVD